MQKNAMIYLAVPSGLMGRPFPRPPRRRHACERGARSAFTVTELLVLVGIFAILLSILIPYISSLREADRRTNCADHLREIWSGMRQYSEQNGKNLPRVTYEPALRPDGWTAYTGADSADPLARGGGVKPNDVTASLWLLVRANLVKAEFFVCPSAGQWADPMVGNGKPVSAAQRGNFSSADHLSYSVACPFSSAPGYRWNTDWMKGDFALVADKSPGVRGKGDNVTAPAYNAYAFDLTQANSANHARAGQNVLYADGHVSFQKTPYCGIGREGQRDNIFTAVAPTPLPENVAPAMETNGYWGQQIGPACAGDSYLVPSDDE